MSNYLHELIHILSELNKEVTELHKLLNSLGRIVEEMVKDEVKP